MSFVGKNGDIFPDPAAQGLQEGRISFRIPERTTWYIGDRETLGRDGDTKWSFSQVQPFGKKVTQRDHLFVGGAHEGVFGIVIIHRASLKRGGNGTGVEYAEINTARDNNLR